jgi:hypothetical protein
VLDPGVVRLDQVLERSQQDVVGVVDRLANLTVLALALDLGLGSRGGRRVVGQPLVQLRDLLLGALVELVVGEGDEAGRNEQAGDDRHEVNEPGHLPYYRQPPWLH